MKQLQRKLFFFFLLPCAFAIAEEQAAVTYTFSGRLGEALFSYMHAKWISYRYDIPLILAPFHYSNDLILDLMEKKPSEKFAHPDHVVHLGKGAQVDPFTQGITLYVVPFFPESPIELDAYPWPYFKVDWEDEKFKTELQKMIQPITPFPVFELPSDRISVAVHVRTGGGFDTEQNFRANPEKFPPNSYYTEQIKLLYEKLKCAPLYLHVFTDDRNPKHIVEFFQNSLQELDILWGYRKENNAHDMNVLEDFFAMTKFDCLIRPVSAYSHSVELISDFRISISPAHLSSVNGVMVVDQVNIVTKTLASQKKF
jgi:hypothetical protein